MFTTMNLHPFIIIVSGFFVILWVYSSLSKLVEWAYFKHAMKTQVFPVWVGKILIYILPPVELGVAALLIFDKTRLYGMYASLFLMGAFTLYIAGAVFNVYTKRPCACGGLFTRLGWNRHFKVNIWLTLIATAGILLMEL